jgi:hypothetical protein
MRQRDRDTQTQRHGLTLDALHVALQALERCELHLVQRDFFVDRVCA